MLCSVEELLIGGTGELATTGANVSLLMVCLDCADGAPLSGVVCGGLTVIVIVVVVVPRTGAAVPTMFESVSSGAMLSSWLGCGVVGDC